MNKSVSKVMCILLCIAFVLIRFPVFGITVYAEGETTNQIQGEDKTNISEAVVTMLDDYSGKVACVVLNGIMP